MLTQQTVVEVARPADAAEIGEFSRRHIEHGLGWRYTPAHVRALLRHPAKNTAVARRHGLLIGFGIMSYGMEHANLDLLGVRPPYRGQGVGTRLVRWLEKVAITAGIANVFVQARQDNRGAIRLYRRLGYHVVDQLPGYYQQRESCIVMCRAIRPLAGRDRPPGGPGSTP